MNKQSSLPRVLVSFFVGVHVGAALMGAVSRSGKPADQVRTYAAASSETPVPWSSAYIGNKNSMIFHYASCSSVAQMKESNKVKFTQRSSAIAQGYRPCKNCNP